MPKLLAVEGPKHQMVLTYRTDTNHKNFNLQEAIKKLKMVADQRFNTDINFVEQQSGKCDFFISLNVTPQALPVIDPREQQQLRVPQNDQERQQLSPSNQEQRQGVASYDQVSQQPHPFVPAEESKEIPDNHLETHKEDAKHFICITDKKGTKQELVGSKVTIPLERISVLGFDLSSDKLGEGQQEASEDAVESLIRLNPFTMGLTYHVQSNHIDKDLPNRILENIKKIAIERYNGILNFTEQTSGQDDLLVCIALERRGEALLGPHKDRSKHFLYLTFGGGDATTKSKKEEALGYYAKIPLEKISVLWLDIVRNLIKNDVETTTLAEKAVGALIKSKRV